MLNPKQEKATFNSWQNNKTTNLVAAATNQM